MGKVTRVDHRWYDCIHEEHEGEEWEHSAIVATYRLEGYEERLFAKVYHSEPITSEGQRREIEPILLRLADEEAEWVAENPDVSAEMRDQAWAAMAEEIRGTDHAPKEG